MLTEELLGFIKAPPKLMSLQLLLFSKKQQELFYKPHHRNHFPHKQQPCCCRYHCIAHGATDLKRSQEYQCLEIQPKLNGILTQFASPPASIPATETFFRPWAPNWSHSILTVMSYFKEILNNCIPSLIYIYNNIHMQLLYHLD